MKLVYQTGNNSAQACIAMITHLDLETVKRYTGGESEISYGLITDALNRLGVNTGNLIITKTQVSADDLPELCMCCQHYNGLKHDTHWVIWSAKDNVWYDPKLGIVYKSKYAKENLRDGNPPVITSYFEILTRNLSIFNIIDAQKVKDYAESHHSLRTTADWAAKEWPGNGIEAGNQIEGMNICKEAGKMLKEYYWDWFK